MVNASDKWNIRFIYWPMLSACASGANVVAIILVIIYLSFSPPLGYLLIQP